MYAKFQFIFLMGAELECDNTTASTILFRTKKNKFLILTHNFNIAARTFSREVYFQRGFFPGKIFVKEYFKL